MGWEHLNYFLNLTGGGKRGLRDLNPGGLLPKIHEHSWYPKKVGDNVIIKDRVLENNVFLVCLTADGMWIWLVKDV